MIIMAAPASSLAGAAIIISTTGPGACRIDGAGFARVAAIEITIGYNSNEFSTPRFTRGALLKGALVAVNTDQAGVIRLGAVTTSPISGGGPLAIVVFEPENPSANPSAGITSLAARLFTIDGKPIPVIVQTEGGK